MPLRMQVEPSEPAERGKPWTPSRGLRLPKPPTPQHMAEIAELGVKFVREMHNVQLDYTIDSLTWIDPFLDSLGASGSDRFAEITFCTGAYVGECLVRDYPFEWVTLPVDAAQGLRFAIGIEAGELRGGPLDTAFDVVDHGHPAHSTFNFARHLIADLQGKGDA